MMRGSCSRSRRRCSRCWPRRAGSPTGGGAPLRPPQGRRRSAGEAASRPGDRAALEAKWETAAPPARSPPRGVPAPAPAGRDPPPGGRRSRGRAGTGAGAARREARVPCALARPHRRRRRSRPNRGAVAAAGVGDAKDDPPDPERGRGLAAAAVRRARSSRWARKRLADFGLDRRGQDRALKRASRAVDERRSVDPARARRAARRRGFETANEFKVHLWLLATLDGEPLSRPRPRRQHVPGADRRLARRARAPAARRVAGRAGAALPARLRAGERARLRSLGRVAASRCAGSGSSGSPPSSKLKVDGDTLIRLKRMPRAPAAPVVRLLGAFDNYNLG